MLNRARSTAQCCLLALLVCAVGPRLAAAGVDTLTWCRGGERQGAICSTDGDCAGGICTARGMPRVCVGRHYCQVSTSIECFTNYECRKENGGRWPEDPNDYCLFLGANATGCDVTAEDSGGSLDCGECAAGIRRGAGCLRDADCGESKCEKPPGAGWCANGAYQCHLERTGHRGMRLAEPHDAIADAAVGQLVTGLNLVGGVDARALYQPTGVAVDKHGDLLIGERRRATRRERPDRHDIGAVAALGQVSLTRSEWDNVSDDVNVGIIDSKTARTLIDHTQRRPVAAVSNSDLRGVLVGDAGRVLLYPERPETNAAAVRVWGHADMLGTRLSDPRRFFTDVAGIATQQRCVDGTLMGTPCSRDSECGGSACATTIAIVDRVDSRILVQRRPPATDGSAFEVFLGQADGQSGGCNRDGLSASSLCEPSGAVFDHDGNLWVADAGNRRVLRFPKGFTTHTAADRSLGQGGRFDRSAQLEGKSGFVSPAGVSWDREHKRLFVVDQGANRVLQFDDPSQNPEAVVAYGQSSLEGRDVGGRSSNGERCDRLQKPADVVYDDRGHIWVADTGNNRVLRFPVTGQPDTPADVLQGQDHCAALKENRVTGSSFQRGPGGIGFYSNGKATGVCASDPNDHRVLCWNDRKVVLAEGPTPEAHAILGQERPTDHWPNRGGVPTAMSLHFPGYPGATSRGQKPGIYIPDSGNNRVLRFETPLRTAMAAKDVFGQPDMKAAECGGGLAGLCNPRASKADRWGNIWVVDSANGRVGVYCMAKDTVPAPASAWVCTKANSGDAKLDLILGKPSSDAIWDKEVCSRPNARSLCTPTDLDVSDLPRRIFVADNASIEPKSLPLLASNLSRTLLYEAPFATGMAAAKVLGTPEGDMNSMGDPALPQSGSDSGFCNGGPRAGQVCTAHDDDKLQGSAPLSSECGPSGFCDWSRSQVDGACLAYDARHDRLYVGRGGGVGVFAGPFPPPQPTKRLGSGHPMIQVFGATGETQFGTTGVGYTVCQQTRQGGCSIDPDGHLWVMQGALQESNAAIFVTFDPGPRPKASPKPVSEKRRPAK